MNTLYEKHRRKGLLALLFLLFRRGKGVGPLFVLLGALSVLFVLPSGVWRGGPFGRFGPGGVPGRAGPGGAFLRGAGEESASDARARARLRGGLWNPMGGRGSAASYGGGSSLDLVSGELPKDKARGGAGAAFLEGLSGRRSVGGILNPEDSRRRADGVALEAGELENGLLNTAFAGGLLGGAAGPAGGGLSGPAGMGKRAKAGLKPGGSGPDAGAVGAADFQQGFLEQAMGQAGESLSDAKSVSAGSARGKLSGYDWKKLAHQIRGAFSVAAAAGTRTDLYMLAVTNAYSFIAKPPSCEGSCPHEFSSNASGVPFDKDPFDPRTGGKGILTEAKFDSTDPSAVPGAGRLQTLVEEANKLEEDARRCEEAQKQIGPQEQRVNAQMQQLSDQFKAMDCGGGGCSADKAKKCMQVGNQMRAKCNEHNQIMQQMISACPTTLERGPVMMNCNQ